MNDTETHSETHVLVSTQVRDTGHLDFPWLDQPQPTLACITDALAAYTSESTLVFGGGEPTLRTDFPHLISMMPEESILATDGLALHKEEVVRMLVERGLKRVRIPIHSARADAHNWLVGIPGAHRRVSSAVQALLANGVAVSTETTLTRPTVPYLEETVAFLYRLGIRDIRFRMLERTGAAINYFVTLSPRFGLMEPSLEAGLQVALRHNMDVALVGLPHCAAPHFGALCLGKPNWLLPEGIHTPTTNEPSAGGCEGCPPRCPGAPRDYTSLFGWTEFSAARGATPPDNHAVTKPLSGPDVPAPPPRANRTPATRVQDAIAQSQRYDLDGDPVIGLPVTEAPSVITVRFPANESARSIKKRLVQAGQQGASTLHIIGDTNHPDALALLREAQRLSFPMIAMSADLTGLKDLPNNALFHLRGIQQILIPNDEQNLKIAHQIAGVASVSTGVFLPLSAVQVTEDLPGLWARNDWPGEPHFAWVPNMDMESMQAAISALPDCAEKDAAHRAIALDPQPLFGDPGSHAILIPDGVSWPNLPPFKVQ